VNNAGIGCCGHADLAERCDRHGAAQASRSAQQESFGRSRRHDLS
jgi:hypothetical protein